MSIAQLLNVRHMEFDVVIETSHTTIIQAPFLSQVLLPACWRKTIKPPRTPFFFFFFICIHGPCLLLDLYKFLVIVVADALTIYSVYNSNVMYKRERKPLQIFA